MFLRLIVSLYVKVKLLHMNYVFFLDKIQQRSGYDVKLSCDLEDLVSIEQMRDIKIRWFFKVCM